MSSGFHRQIGVLMWGVAVALFTALGIALGLSIPGKAQAETVRLVVGEYAPFVGKQLPASGVTAAIVVAAFRDQGVDVELSFLPWQRGYIEAARGQYVGTFPYLKTAQRESEFYFSEPILSDHFRLFVRDPKQKISDWKRGVVCVPLGYDTTQIQTFRDTYRL